MPPDQCPGARRDECSLAALSAKAAAEEAVKNVFAILGVNVNDPRQVEDFREDLRFGRRLRRMADKGSMAMVVAVAIGIVGALLVGIQSKFGIR